MEYPRQNLYVTAFLRRYWPHCASWPIENLRSWVQWFLGHDRCLIITDKGKLVCVAFFRLVTDLAECDTNYQDSNGPIVYIEVTAARRTEGMKAAFNHLRRLVGNRVSHIAWVRGKYDNRPSVYTMSNAARHLTYGRTA